MRKALVFAAIACVVVVAMAVVLAGCASPSSSGGGTSTPPATGGTSGGAAGGATGGVTIDESGFAFNPSSATAAVGQVVTFTNSDSVDHHVVVGTDDLGVQAPGASVTWTAKAAGSFPIKCIIHPSMTGEITVK
jgi:plastocyanin